MVENTEFGEFKGATEEALKDIRSDVKYIRTQIDKIIESQVNHDKRLVRIELTAKIGKWLLGVLLALAGLAIACLQFLK